MSDLRQVEGGRLAIGDIAPKLATLTDAATIAREVFDTTGADAR
jgi:hypothetical protein